MAFRALSLSDTTLARSRMIATSVKLATLQTAVLSVAGGGPTFPAGQEPLQDGTAYTATDGIAYYRPFLAVAPRARGMRPGPDVWFRKDDAGDITLQWTLQTVPFGGQPAGAVPLPFTLSSVQLVWAQGSFDFPAPGLQPVEGAAPGEAAFLIHGGAALLAAKAAELEAAMNHPESACRLVVTYGYEYNVEVPAAPPPPPPPDPVVSAPGGISIADTVVGSLRPKRLRLGGLRTSVSSAAFSAGIAAHIAAAPVAAAAVAPAAPVAVTPKLLRRRVSSSMLDALSGIRISDIIAQPTRPEGRTQTVTREVPFVFEPSDEQNGPIYRSLHGAANLTGEWVRGEAGWMCASELPNTVNRLPDDLRLAWDTELGGPHMVPTLHRNAAGDMRVRLLLRLAPWHDPRRRDTVRKLVSMPAAHVMIGEVEASTLRLGGSFPEELAVVGDPSAPAPLTGLDLTLDLSLAYYQLFCKQIATAVGVPGTVDVVLSSTPGGEGTTPDVQSTVVPVSLRLDRIDDLPCTVTLPETPSPRTLTVRNDSGADVTLGGASITLLQVDEESVVPVDAYAGRCTSTFPVTIPAGGSVELSIEPVDEDEPAEGSPPADASGAPAPEATGETPADLEDTALLWNGVLVELFDKRLVTTPDQMLKHVHELAGATDMTRDVVVSSPVFATGTLPERWANLVSIEVEVTPPGSAATSVVLSLASPSRPLPAPVTLHDIATGAPGGITAVTYRVRNNYVDHQGAWTDPQQQSGTDLVVYPNAAVGD